ncbi:MAG: hypothetical protein ACR2KX_14765 [Chitinophagaceae bacterium]
MKKQLPDITICIIMDLIGCASYVLPFLGEFTDLIWAPLSGMIFYSLFGKRLGVLGGAFSFIEELLPGLDFIPTFTIAWFMRKKEIEKETSMKRLKVIQY